jgi:hypothetical protein
MNNNDPYFEAHSPAAIWPERVTNVYERKLAQNTKRRGTVQAAEGLAQRTAAEPNFADEFGRARANSAPVYEARVAYGRSPLADGTTDSGNPAWSDVDANLAAFQGSAAAQELHRAWNGGGRVPSLSERSTPSTFTDLSWLDLRERGRQTYGYSMGNDVRQFRRNEAEVED